MTRPRLVVRDTGGTAMSKKKPGDWWDRSWSVVTGCNWPPGEVPGGCKNCWAERLVRRFPAMHATGKHPDEIVMHPERLDQPLRRRKPTVYAVSLLGDLFHPEVPDEFIAAVFGVAAACPQQQFVLLTKRPARVVEWFRWVALTGDRHKGNALQVCQTNASERLHGVKSAFLFSSPWPLPNVHILASCWDQASVDDAARHLAPLGVSWGLHLEPLLGPVDMDTQIGQGVGDLLTDYQHMSWVVVGGEKGPGARPMHPDWARQVRDQCSAAGVPFWLKQLDKTGTRTLDGREHNETPWTK